MLPEIQKLLVIQDRDQRCSGLAEEVERLPREAEGAKLRLSGDVAAVAAVEKKIQENEVAIKGLELEVVTRKDSIAKLKVQQFETRKNEEFQAIGHEIERYGKDISGLEDRELELMENGDILKAELTAAKDSLTKTQDVVDTELGIIEKRRKECEAQLEETQQGRATLAAEIDPDLLREFERIFAGKKGTAVVELENGICKGCHMKVHPGTATATRRAEEVAHCDQCGRILYLA